MPAKAGIQVTLGAGAGVLFAVARLAHRFDPGPTVDAR